MPSWIVDLFARYGYAVVFFGVFLENAGLPVPGETMLLAGAALAHFGHLSLPIVVGTAILAAILGDNLGFWIGRHGGRRLAERYGPPLGLTLHRLAGFDRFFLKHGPKTVFLARFVTGLRVLGAMLAGASGMRWPTFLAYNAAGAVAWSMTFGAVGYLLGRSWDLLEEWIGRAGLAGLGIVVVFVIIWIATLRREQES